MKHSRRCSCSSGQHIITTTSMAPDQWIRYWCAVHALLVCRLNPPCVQAPADCSLKLESLQMFVRRRAFLKVL